MSIRGASVFKDSPRREYRAAPWGRSGLVLVAHGLAAVFVDGQDGAPVVRGDGRVPPRIFSHQDFVTAIDFHPLNDKYFLSGSLDGKLRLWSIPDHHVADWVDIGEMVTAAAFNSDGSTCTAGSYKGKCHFYAMDGVRFEYLTHLEVRHSRGGSKNSGKKITGLAFMPGDDRKLLVTSNDSRVRVYDGYHLACKYKGHKNNNSQIRASFSPGAEFIVCGSEDENVYVWSTVNSFVPSINPIYTGFRRDKHSSYESFRANDGTSDITTAALFAPKGVRDARRGEAAAAVAKARAAAQSEIKPRAPPPRCSAAGRRARWTRRARRAKYGTATKHSAMTRSSRALRGARSGPAGSDARRTRRAPPPRRATKTRASLRATRTRRRRRPGRGGEGEGGGRARVRGGHGHRPDRRHRGVLGEICVFENVGSPAVAVKRRGRGRRSSA